MKGKTTTYYVGDDLFLREVQASAIPAGTVLIRVGLTDGSEHRIAIPQHALTANIRDGMLIISNAEGVFRIYRTWTWYDEAPHVATAGPQVW